MPHQGNLNQTSNDLQIINAINRVIGKGLDITSLPQKQNHHLAILLHRKI